MGIKLDEEICLGCGHVGPPPEPPALSCCPERDTITLEDVERWQKALRKIARQYEHGALGGNVRLARSALSGDG